MQYDDIYAILGNVVITELNKKYGFSNTKGEEVIPPKYTSINGFKKGLAVVGISTGEFSGKYGLVTKSLEEIIPPKYDKVYIEPNVITMELNGKCGLLNKNGEEVVPPKYDSLYPSENGYSIVTLDGKTGIINKQGKEFFMSANYSDVNTYTEGLAGLKSSLNGKWGYVNKKGEEVIKPKYDDAFYFKDGFSIVELDGKYGFVNPNGEEIFFTESIDMKSAGNPLYYLKYQDKVMFKIDSFSGDRETFEKTVKTSYYNDWQTKRYIAKMKELEQELLA